MSVLLFYALSTGVASVLTFLFLCLNVKSKSILNKVMNVCGKVVGEIQEHLKDKSKVRGDF